MQQSAADSVKGAIEEVKPKVPQILLRVQLMIQAS